MRTTCVRRPEDRPWRAPVPPLTVQAPLAAWIDQPVAGERFQDVQPGGSLAARRQTLSGRVNP